MNVPAALMNHRYGALKRENEEEYDETQETLEIY